MVQKDAWYDCNLHEVKVVLWPKKLSVLENFPCLFCCFWIKCSMYIYWTMWYNVSFKADVFSLTFLSGESFHWYQWGIKVPYYYYVVISPFRSVNIFWCSYFGCIYIYNCYVFLLGWPLYNYVVSLFVIYYSLGFKVSFA